MQICLFDTTPIATFFLTYTPQIWVLDMQKSNQMLLYAANPISRVSCNLAEVTHETIIFAKFLGRPELLR